MKKIALQTMRNAAFLLALCAAQAASAAPPIERAPVNDRSRSNPFGQEETARKAGEKLFRRECAECHGRNAEGYRKAPPLDVPMVAGASPGAIFWVLRNGSLYRGMPSFAHLPEPQRWQIVTYLQSLAGTR